MRERLGVFLSIFFAVTAAAETQSFVTGTPAIRIVNGAVTVDQGVFFDDVIPVVIEGKMYRPTVERVTTPGNEVIRFTLPGARTSSTITRLGGRTEMTLVTAKILYRVRPFAEGTSAFLLESTHTNVTSKAHDLENDTMTPFEVAVRTGTFTSLSVQPLAVPATGRRRAVASGDPVEHKHIAIYTARFAAHYGSNADNVRLAIQHLFDVRDSALRDSGVFGIRDVLVYAEERNDPTWLATTQNGNVLGMFGLDPYVQGLRVRYQANAGYWDDNPSKASSIAVIFEGNLASLACGTYVIQWHLDGLDRTVSHELGHVGGAEHNKANANSGACPYCFGWYNSYVRDIMAVACGDMDCHDIAIYSSPAITYNANFWDYHASVVMGSAEENVARRLSETRTDVRDFWKTIPSP